MDKIDLDDGIHAWMHRLGVTIYLERLRSFHSQNELRLNLSTRKLCITLIGRWAYLTIWTSPWTSTLNNQIYGFALGTAFIQNGRLC